MKNWNFFIQGGKVFILFTQLPICLTIIETFHLRPEAEGSETFLLFDGDQPVNDLDTIEKALELIGFEYSLEAQKEFDSLTYEEDKEDGVPNSLDFKSKKMFFKRMKELTLPV